jgi:cytidylate kinase
MPVVTIARQFGAGGEAVGAIVARELRADLVDKQIVSQVADRLQLSQDEVEAQDEAPGSFLNRLLTALGSGGIEFSAPPEVAAWVPPYADPAFDPRKAILRITQEVIREAARTGNAVIVGRGAAYVLMDDPTVVHAFLHGSKAARLEVVKELFGLDEEEARRRIKQTDANRAAYIKQVYGHDWSHPGHYHIVVDTGRLTYETAAQAILAAVRGLS